MVWNGVYGAHEGVNSPVDRATWIDRLQCRLTQRFHCALEPGGRWLLLVGWWLDLNPNGGSWCDGDDRDQTGLGERLTTHHRNRDLLVSTGLDELASIRTDKRWFDQISSSRYIHCLGRAIIAYPDGSTNERLSSYATSALSEPLDYLDHALPVIPTPAGCQSFEKMIFSDVPGLLAKGIECSINLCLDCPIF